MKYTLIKRIKDKFYKYWILPWGACFLLAMPIYADDNLITILQEGDNFELDIDMLDVDFLKDLLDVVEALEKTRVSLADAQASAGDLGGFRLKGAQVGFNKDSQFNVFEQDGNLVFFRSVNGVINIIIGAGGSGFIDVVTNDYEGVMQFNDGDGIEIYINQSN